jgi:hypothetical protein
MHKKSDMRRYQTGKLNSDQYENDEGDLVAVVWLRRLNERRK